MAKSAVLNVMEQAAMKAARILRFDFGEVENLQVSRKGPADFVSTADHRAEQIIFESLQKARPDYGFLMEERGEEPGKDTQHRWIVDPLDGTTNFLHGLPIFAVSIALESQGEIVAGLIYNPISDDLYTAQKGVGAYLNDRRIRVSGRNTFSECVVGTGIPHFGRSNHSEYVKELDQVMREVSGVRRFGSAAMDLAWVASGRMDGFWEYDLNYWDIAAGLIMVREAGGFVSGQLESDTKPTEGLIVAGNDYVHGKLREILNNNQ